VAWLSEDLTRNERKRVRHLFLRHHHRVDESLAAGWHFGQKCVDRAPSTILAATEKGTSLINNQ
jgi:hypothetical protein